MPIPSVIGATLLASFGVLVLLLNGRAAHRRPSYAVLSARIRSAGAILLAVAILVAGTGASFAGGFLMFVGCAVLALAAVVVVRGNRAAGSSGAHQ